MKFNPQDPKTPPKNKKRKRDVTWFNPPFNLTVKTNIGKEFLKLVDECFPPQNPLSKIFNRQTIKVSYSTTANMEKIISSANSKVLKAEETPKRSCSCPKNSICPLNGQCLEKGIVYHAKVTQSNQKVTNYIGQTSTDFKSRHYVHEQTFRDLTVSQTALSKHIHELKSKDIDYEISWRIVGRGKEFSPVTNVCTLCDCEKYFILFHPDLADLNKKNEFYSHCMHKKSKLLIKKKRGRPKKSPG